MEAIFLGFINRSITAGWLVLAVMVLRQVLGRAPRSLRCLLWALVALRLVLPISIPSPASLVPSAQTIVPQSIFAARPVIETGIPAVNSQVSGYLQSVYYEGVTVPTGTAAHVTDVLAIVWLAGVAVMLLYCLGTWFHLRSRLRTAVRLRDNLWQSEWVDFPFVLGLFAPRIYLPFRLDEETLGQVEAHERCHIARGDHVWKVLAFLLLALHWFQPLLWLAYLLFCRDLEYACDERVVRQMDAAERRRYSDALLRCSAPRRSPAPCPVAFGEVGVGGRIKNVLRYRRPAFWVALIAAVAVIVTAVCFLTDPPAKNAEQWMRTRTPGLLGRTELSVAYDEHGNGAYYSFDEFGSEQRRTLAKLLRAVNPDQMEEAGSRALRPVGCSLFFPKNGVYLSLPSTPDASGDAVELQYQQQLYLIRDRELADFLRTVLPTEELVWHQFNPLRQGDKGPNILAIDLGFACDSVYVLYGSGLLDRGTPPLNNLNPDGTTSRLSGSVTALAGSWLHWTPPIWDEEDPSFATGFSIMLQGGTNDGKGLVVDVHAVPTYWGSAINGIDYHMLILKNTLPVRAAMDGDILRLRDEDYVSDAEYPENMRGADGQYYNDFHDVASFDVDGDGVEETCSLGMGFTSGVFTFTMSARVDGRIKYADIFRSDWADLSFVRGSNGRQQVCAVAQDGTQTLYDISVQDGHIVLTSDGEALRSLSSASP